MSYQKSVITYIGDGVYIEKVSPYDYKLYTSNGITESNKIYLDIHTTEALVAYLKENFKKE